MLRECSAASSVPSLYRARRPQRHRRLSRWGGCRRVASTVGELQLSRVCVVSHGSSDARSGAVGAPSAVPQGAVAPSLREHLPGARACASRLRNAAANRLLGDRLASAHSVLRFLACAAADRFDVAIVATARARHGGFAAAEGAITSRPAWRQPLRHAIVRTKRKGGDVMRRSSVRARCRRGGGRGSNRLLQSPEA